MYKAVVLALLLVYSFQVRGAVIEIDYSFDLNNGAVYECVDGSNTSKGAASKCWTNAWYDTAIANTVISDLDTVLIDISFLLGQKLRWYDDNNTFFSEYSELLQIGLDSSIDSFGTGGIDHSFSFKDVSGNPLFSQVNWTMNPLANGGGAFVHSSNSGTTNLTDSYFEFSGITVKMELFNLSTYSTNLNSVSVDNLSIFLTSGNFEVIENAVSVPEPSAYALFLIALLGLIIRKKKSI